MRYDDWDSLSLLTKDTAVLREEATMRELREDGRRMCLRQCARETSISTSAIATDCQLHRIQSAGPTVLSLVFDGVVPIIPVRD